MGGLFRVLLVVGVVAKFWWVILLVLAAISVGLALWLGQQRAVDASRRQRREYAELAARADQQHAWVLAGDDRGVYGSYAPERTD